MADGGLFVYGCARDAHVQITQLSDFISPTVVAMWNLRWQVQGFVAAYPQAKQTDLVQRFALGSNMKGNEIKRACIDNSWEEQEARFASVLLTNTISIFEDFLENLAGLTLSGEQKRRAYKALQYPSLGAGRGYVNAYSELGVTVDELAGVFTSPTVQGKWYSGSSLQNLLICYRFFKEIRNSLAHNGGKSTAAVMDAYDRFKVVATTAALGIKEVPAHEVPVLNKPYHLQLRGMYGFSDVVLRLIATYDIDLSDKQAALTEIIGRLGSIEGSSRARVEETKQKKRIEGLLRRSFFPSAILTPNFISFLKSTNRIPSYW